MDTVSFLFDASGELLGELFTQDGAYRQAVLTARGEELLGDHFSSWQTQGVPIGQERVLFRHAHCLRAIDGWLRCMGMELLTATPVILECWHVLARHEMNASERRDVLRSLVDAPPSDIAAWRMKLDLA